MAKRVNTISPWLLAGYFIFGVGFGILVFLYYLQNETDKKFLAETKEFKKEFTRLLEVEVNLKKKIKANYTPSFGPDLKKLPPKDLDAALIDLFSEKLEGVSNSKTKLEIIRDIGATIDMIQEKTRKSNDSIKKENEGYVAKVKKLVDANEQLMKNQEQNVDALKLKFDDQVKQCSGVLSGQREEITQLEGEKESLELNLKNKRDEAKLNDSIYTSAVQKHALSVDKLSVEIQKLAEQLKRKEAIARYKRELEEDGQILNTTGLLRGKTVVINLGQRDRVTKGMRFTVYRMANGGTQKVKGELVIRRVDTNTSLCGVAEVEDPMEPFAQGDMLANRVYRKDGKYNFYMIGTYENFSRNELRRLIEREGSKVVEELHSSRVDYVIVGNFDSKVKDGQNELFEKALKLNLNTMNETEIRRFLRDYSE